MLNEHIIVTKRILRLLQVLAKNRRMSEAGRLPKTGSEQPSKNRSQSFGGSSTYVITKNQQKSPICAKNSKNSSNNIKKGRKSTSDGEGKLSFDEWFRCRRCSLQFDWDNRLYGNIHEQFKNVGQNLIEKLGKDPFFKSVEFLLKIWDQKHSNPVNELTYILGSENMDIFPQLIKYVAMKKSFSK